MGAVGIMAEMLVFFLCLRKVNSEGGANSEDVERQSKLSVDEKRRMRIDYFKLLLVSNCVHL